MDDARRKFQMAGLIDAATEPLCSGITAFYGGRAPEDLCAERHLTALTREGLTLRCHNVISGDVAECLESRRARNGCQLLCCGTAGNG